MLLMDHISRMKFISQSSPKFRSVELWKKTIILHQDISSEKHRRISPFGLKNSSTSNFNDSDTTEHCFATERGSSLGYIESDNMLPFSHRTDLLLLNYAGGRHSACLLGVVLLSDSFRNITPQQQKSHRMWKCQYFIRVVISMYEPHSLAKQCQVLETGWISWRRMIFWLELLRFRKVLLIQLRRKFKLTVHLLNLSHEQYRSLENTATWW